MLAPTDIMEMRRRLIGWSVRHFKIAPDLAEDAVSHAICGALEAGAVTHSYCSVAVRNYILVYWRNRKTRNEDYAPPVGEEGEAIEFASSASPAMQHLHMEAIECINFIECMPLDIAPVMRYLATGHTVEEISKLLAAPFSRIKLLAVSGRRLLRDRDGYDVERKKGHHKFVGIRKCHRIWEARIKVGESDQIIGYFKTASEAAKAFEERAIEIRGPDYLKNLGRKTIRDAVKASGRSRGWLERNKCSACDRTWLIALRSGCGECAPERRDFGTKGTWGGTWE